MHGTKSGAAVSLVSTTLPPPQNPYVEFPIHPGIEALPERIAAMPARIVGEAGKCGTRHQPALQPLPKQPSWRLTSAKHKAAAGSATGGRGNPWLTRGLAEALAGLPFTLRLTSRLGALLSAQTTRRTREANPTAQDLAAQYAGARGQGPFPTTGRSVSQCRPRLSGLIHTLRARGTHIAAGRNKLVSGDLTARYSDARGKHSS